MPTYLELKNSHEYKLPEHFMNDDVRFAGALVKHFLGEFTEEGDVVLDPFAGFGTTLFVAEAMGRIPFGLELLPERAAFIRERIQVPSRLILGDARRLSAFDLPQVQFSITSPPYSTPRETENPLNAYRTEEGTYETYLNGVREIYRQLAEKLAPDGRAVIEVANIKHDWGVTPLAWNIAEKVSEVMRFEGEIIVCWDHYATGYEHSYCLVFSK